MKPPKIQRNRTDAPPALPMTRKAELVRLRRLVDAGGVPVNPGPVVAALFLVIDDRERRLARMTTRAIDAEALEHARRMGWA